MGRLKGLKPQSLSKKTKNTIQAKIKSNDDFNAEKIKTINQAAASICKWVIAVSSFTDVWEMIEEKKKVVDDMDTQLKKANKKLSDKQNLLNKVLD